MTNFLLFYFDTGRKGPEPPPPLARSKAVSFRNLAKSEKTLYNPRTTPLKWVQTPPPSKISAEEEGFMQIPWRRCPYEPKHFFFHEILSFRTYSFYEKCNIACFGHLIHRKIVSTDEPCTVFYDGSESGVKMARNRVPGPENSPNIICFDSGFVANLASPPPSPP